MFQHSKEIGKFRLQGEDGLDRSGGDDIVEKLLPISAGEYKQTFPMQLQQPKHLPQIKIL